MSKLHDTHSATAYSRRKLSGIAMMVFSAFGGILFGYDTGTISGILRMDDWLRTFGDPVSGTQGPDLRFELPTALESVVVSLLFAGTVVGEYHTSYRHFTLQLLT